MFFAHQCLRPALADQPPPLRLAVMARRAAALFLLVWAAVALLAADRSSQIVAPAASRRGAPVHACRARHRHDAAVRALFFAPNRRLQAAVASADWPTAGANLGTIRRIVEINSCSGC